MEPFTSWGIATLVGAFVGSFLGSYLKKKGENLATHEDVDKLVEQVKAVTQATKEIEAKISSDVWDRQKRWEMKREATFGAAKILSDMANAISALDQSMRNRNPYDARWVEENQKIGEAWNRVSEGFELTATQVAIACSPQTLDAMQDFHAQASKCAGLLLQNRVGEATASYDDLEHKRFVAIHAIRGELGVEVTLQSTGFSAAPSPDSPIPE